MNTYPHLYYLAQLFLELVQFQTFFLEETKAHRTFNKFFNVSSLIGNNV
jgi:hypothetical protein